MTTPLFSYPTALPLPQASASKPWNLGAIWDSLINLWNGFLHQIPYMVMGLLVFGLFLIASRVVRRILMEAGARTRLPENVGNLFGRIASVVILILGIFVAAVVVFPAFKPGDLITGLGITSVAIGFAFKDIMQNFFAGILILWRQPFVVGDQIQSHALRGHGGRHQHALHTHPHV